MAFGHPRVRRLLVAAATLVAAVTVTTTAASAAAGPTASSATVHVIDLGTLSTTTCCSAALAINATGDIVGWSDIDAARSAEHAVRWHNGHITDLGTLGGSSSQALAVNKFGTAVGWSLRSDGAQHATMWRDGQIIDLGTLGGRNSIATGINDNGGVVGSADDANGIARGFIWRNGVITKLATPPNTVFAPQAINANGRIVGTLGDNPARWDNGHATALATDTGHARAVTTHGVIAGDVVHGMQQFAFVYKNATLTRLALPAGNAGVAIAFGINNTCHVVGEAFFTSGAAFRPTHWPACGAPKVLPGLSGGTNGTGQANGVNDANQIVGTSSLAAGGGPFHAVLWTA